MNTLKQTHPIENEELKAALDEFRMHAQGRLQLKKTKVRLQPIDVKKIRLTLEMGQQEFADAFDFALSTLRNWEQGIRQPEGSARVLLKLIERNPDFIKSEISKFANANHD